MSVISGLNGTDLFVTLEALPDDFENQLYLFTVSPAVDQFTTLFSVLGSNIFSIFFSCLIGITVTGLYLFGCIRLLKVEHISLFLLWG